MRKEKEVIKTKQITINIYRVQKARLVLFNLLIGQRFLSSLRVLFLSMSFFCSSSSLFFFLLDKYHNLFLNFLIWCIVCFLYYSFYRERRGKYARESKWGAWLLITFFFLDMNDLYRWYFIWNMLVFVCNYILICMIDLSPEHKALCIV